MLITVDHPLPLFCNRNDILRQEKGNLAKKQVSHFAHFLHYSPHFPSRFVHALRVKLIFLPLAPTVVPL